MSEVAAQNRFVVGLHRQRADKTVRAGRPVERWVGARQIVDVPVPVERAGRLVIVHDGGGGPPADGMDGDATGNGDQLKVDILVKLDGGIIGDHQRDVLAAIGRLEVEGEVGRQVIGEVRHRRVQDPVPQVVGPGPDLEPGEPAGLIAIGKVGAGLNVKVRIEHEA